MSIYFIRMSNSNFFKIGKAVNPIRRLAMLQTGCPHELELFGVIDSGDSLEGVLHERFRNSRVRGEWFELSEQDARGVIEKYQKGGLAQVDVSIRDLLLAAEKEDELTIYGFGVLNQQKITQEEYQEKFTKDRQSLLSKFLQFEQCCKWLSMCHGVKRLTRSSYGLKHDVERYFNTYIANGVLIAALIHTGFKYKKFPPNARVAIGVPNSIIIQRDESLYAPGGKVEKRVVLNYLGIRSWNNVSVEDLERFDREIAS